MNHPEQPHWNSKAKVAMREKSECGAAMGKAPLGYRNVRDYSGASVEVDEDVAPLVREAFDLLAAKGTSLRRTLAVVTERGLKSRRGKPLSFSTFQEMVNNPFYIGMVRYDGKLYQGNHEPLISAETFYRVKGRLSERQNRPPQS